MAALEGSQSQFQHGKQQIVFAIAIPRISSYYYDKLLDLEPINGGSPPFATWGEWKSRWKSRHVVTSKRWHPRKLMNSMTTLGWSITSRQLSWDVLSMSQNQSYVCMYVYIHIHIHQHTHKPIHIHRYIICIYIYILICTMDLDVSFERLPAERSNLCIQKISRLNYIFDSKNTKLCLALFLGIHLFVFFVFLKFFWISIKSKNPKTVNTFFLIDWISEFQKKTKKWINIFYWIFWI